LIKDTILATGMDNTNQQEEAIFQAAREFPDPGRRQAYIEGACAHNPELRRRVEALFSAQPDEEKFFAEGVAAIVSSTVLAPLIEKPGEMIGRYKLLQKIGEGGCGVVYMAEQQEPVRRRVALKVIKLGMDTKQVIARFEAERQALALMDHPNIAKILDGGVTETGRPYFVMDLVQGLPIIEFCDEAKLSTRQRLDLFLEVCSAVQHAHQKGIIHRDIKPSNILVTLHGDKPVPKVIDFGIAKATQQPLTDKTVFTQFQQFIGTPAYMSPEQATLSGLDIDTRSDIYSLGVLLYELLTGKTPFDAKELVQAGLDEMRRTIREEEPDRPSTKVSTLGGEELTTTARRRGLEAPKLVNALRGDLDWIVMKCLEKDRARRYDTANGLATDIQRHLSNEPVMACPPSRIYRLQKTIRRNKVAFAAATAIALSVFAGLAASTWMFFMERTAKRAQERLRLQAQAEAAKSQQVAQYFKDMLNGVGPSVALGRDTTILGEILDKAAASVGAQFTNQPDVEISLRDAIAGVYLELNQLNKAEAMESSALRIGKQLYGQHDPALGSILAHLTLIFFSARRYGEAEHTAQEALAILRAAPPSKQTQGDLAETLDALGKTYRYQDKKVEALTVLREALETKRKLWGNASLEIADALNAYGKAVREHGDPAEADAMFREALRILDQNHVPQTDLSRAGVLCNLSIACQLAGKFDDAEEAERAAVAVFRNVVKAAGERPDLGLGMASYYADYFGDLSALLLKQGKWEEAQGLQREVLQSLEKAANSLSMGKQAQDDPDILWARGHVLARLGRWKEAVADLMRVRELRPPQALCWLHLAALFTQTGDIDAYGKHCRLALERFADTTDPIVAEQIAKACLYMPSSQVDLVRVSTLANTAMRLGNDSGSPSWHFCEGLVEYRQGHFAAAAEWMQRTLADLRDPKIPVPHANVGKEDASRDVTVYAILAMASQQLGKTAEAGTSLSKAEELAETKMPRMGQSDIRWWFDNWVLAHALLREAKELFEGLAHGASVQNPAFNAESQTKSPSVPQRSVGSNQPKSE
jgi:serine/threonine protein kinase/tetratricopeptide (TPR) repeat protein